MTSMPVQDQQSIIHNHTWFYIFIEYGLKPNKANLVGSLPIFTISNCLLQWQDLIPSSLMYFAYKDDHKRQYQPIALIISMAVTCF